jgi:uncharacterized protein YeeX (DUF496 family)
MLGDIDGKRKFGLQRGPTMNTKKQRAEYKRRRTVAIKKLREAGMSEEEIREELAKLQSDYELRPEAEDSVPNLPAVIERRTDSAEEASNREPLDRPRPNKPYGGIDPKDFPPGYAVQHDSALNKNPERRCVAKNSRGEQCRKFAIYGGRVCRTHGGATRHVKEQARIRVEMHSNALMGKLIEIAYDDTRPASVQLDAIKDSLNRAGLTKPAQVEVGPMTPQEEIFTDLLAGGSREAYRNHTVPIDGLDDSPHIQSSETASSPYDYGPASNEPVIERTTRANGDHTPHPATWADGDLDPLNGPPASETSMGRPSQRADRTRRSQSPPAVTGEEAIRQANIANGLIDPDVFGLPPGHSYYQ